MEDSTTRDDHRMLATLASRELVRQTRQVAVILPSRENLSAYGAALMLVWADRAKVGGFEDTRLCA